MARITEQQAEFVAHFTNDPGAIGNAAESARRAGYSVASAREIGRRLLDKPHVQDAIRESNQQLISGQIATKAVALLERVIDDESAPLKLRVEASKTILDRAGFAATPTPRLPAWSSKDPSEMTDAELVDYIRAMQAVIDRAKGHPAPMIDVTPEPPPAPAAPPSEAVTGDRGFEQGAARSMEG